MPITAAISITASQNPICTGTSVTFTAVNTNGIPSPVYQWQINGGNVGTNSTTFTSTTLANSNLVTCLLTSSDPCVTGTPATSNTIVMTVANSFTASVSVVISPNDTICAGTTINFTATAVNGGPLPTYSWTLNGAPVGTNSTTYSNSALVNGDIVACSMLSSLPCATSNPAINATTITVDPGGATDVTVVAAPGNIACPGQNVVFTATPVNAGTTPTYQWFVNGLPVGTNSTTYITNTLITGDVVTCQVTSSSLCTTGSPATSIPMVMTITTTLTPTVVVSPATVTVCQGDSITFWAAATEGGTNPIYQWQWNGSNVGANQDYFSGNSFVNGDQITCVFISSDPCAFNGTPIASNTVILDVQPCPVPVSKFVTSKSLICINECISFFDESDNDPIGWHWQFQGANPPESYDRNPTSICYPTSGIFNVTLITNNARGFHDTTLLGHITVDPIATINAGEDVEIQVGTSTQLQATGSTNFFWTPPVGLSCIECASTLASPTVTTTYVANDTIGCPGSDSVTVKVFEDFEIYVPNAFSPNGDGQNDELFVRGNGIREIYLVIFDRIGEKVYVGTNKDLGWDGTFRGKTLNPGVFSYYVKAYMIDGSVKSDKGNVTLFR